MHGSTSKEERAKVILLVVVCVLQDGKVTFVFLRQPEEAPRHCGYEDASNALDTFSVLQHCVGAVEVSTMEERRDRGVWSALAAEWRPLSELRNV